MDEHHDARTGRPPGPLRGGVTYQGYDLRGGVPGTHRGLPSPYLTFIVTLGEPLTMRAPSGELVTRDTVIGGLHTEPVEIVHDGTQRGIHLTVHPLAARALLGMPTAELALDVDAAEVLGAAAREMHERVGEARSWAQRFAALDDVLIRRLGNDTATGTVAPELRRAWRSLVAPSGASVRAVADDVGWSDRHLGQRFRTEFGVPPKVAARMARFDRARRLIARRAGSGAPLGLAGIAADGGYADQAHLTREFRALAGTTPTGWIAEEIGNLQDGPSVAPDDERHE